MGVDFESVMAEMAGVKVATTPPVTVTRLSDVEKLILASDVRSLPMQMPGDPAVTPDAVASALREGRIKLAQAIGCGLDEIEEVVRDKENWESLVVEKRIELGLSAPTLIDADWDSLEQVAVTKLLALVKMGNINNVDQLLAIAKAANTANRSSRSPRAQPRTGLDIGIGIGIGGNTVADDKLPSGNLGTISLNISNRVQRQLSSARQEKEARLIDTFEMMELEDIQEVGQNVKDSES